MINGQSMEKILGAVAVVRGFGRLFLALSVLQPEWKDRLGSQSRPDWRTRRTEGYRSRPAFDGTPVS